MTQTAAAPLIDVTTEARKSLLDHLARSGAARFIRVHVGIG
jgi:hypothetical protein